MSTCAVLHGLYVIQVVLALTSFGWFMSTNSGLVGSCVRLVSTDGFRCVRGSLQSENISSPRGIVVTSLLSCFKGPFYFLHGFGMRSPICRGGAKKRLKVASRGTRFHIGLCPAAMSNSGTKLSGCLFVAALGAGIPVSSSPVFFACKNISFHGGGGHDCDWKKF